MNSGLDWIIPYNTLCLTLILLVSSYCRLPLLPSTVSSSLQNLTLMLTPTKVCHPIWLKCMGCSHRSEFHTYILLDEKLLQLSDNRDYGVMTDCTPKQLTAIEELSRPSKRTNVSKHCMGKSKSNHADVHSIYHF